MRRDHPSTDYHNRRVTVMGLGSFGGGVGAVKFLAARGARITVTDTRTPDQLAESLHALRGIPIEHWRLGEHITEDFITADFVVVNPAVTRDHPLLKSCRERDIPLTSEMNLFWQHNRGTVLAVTGSNGKSTTTALLHSILQQTGRRCWLGGNLGHSLLPAVEEIAPDDLVILELSSFQLADLEKLQVSPHVGIVTNFSPNHLDWHGTLDDYRASKETILRWQTPADIAVLNADDAEVSSWPTKGLKLLFGLNDHGQWGIRWNGTSAVWRTAGRALSFPLHTWLTLPGRHNLANALAASAAALAVGADVAAVQRGIETYQPLPHRLQLVGTAADRRFYNDSLATTPESTLVALDAFADPIILIAGGYDKQVDLSSMARGIASRTKAVALIGQTAPVLRAAIAAAPQSHTMISPHLPDFETAFAWAVSQSAAGDVILLSPGCASYDWFRHFADRGTRFEHLVHQWIAAPT
ncbi:MAG: UDP-N-acetylmuramoyl-L-alanine--D-glutamate ligase [Planctomycetaceae bacterium]|nr:UDP-N-acetylmuramoyl-L-alanine--D-glutamate ligase [Planctomycetaceae bacterium]